MATAAMTKRRTTRMPPTRGSLGMAGSTSRVMGSGMEGRVALMTLASESGEWD
jgi:hypothetical protein